MSTRIFPRRPSLVARRSLVGTSLLALSVCAAAQSSAPKSGPTDIYIYPKNGQTEQQQSIDRYECHNWAQSQTGFDPTQSPPSGVSSSQQAVRRADYRRAMTACLDARGYSVSAPPAAAVPPSPPPPPPVHYPAPHGDELQYHPLQMHIDGGYTLTTGAAKQYLDGGGSAGLGFTWFPSSALPVGLRVDGSYSWFNAKDKLLSPGGYTEGHQHIYGGDADVQFDLAHRDPRSKLYLVGGIGWYRQETQLRQVSLQNGIICWWDYCGAGVYPVVTAEQNTTSPWRNSWNAGIGWETAVGTRASFFVEARYRRLKSKDSALPTYMEFVPIKIGFRF